MSRRMRITAGTAIALAMALAGVAPVANADPGVEQEFQITSDVPTLEKPMHRFACSSRHRPRMPSRPRSSKAAVAL